MKKKHHFVFGMLISIVFIFLIKIKIDDMNMIVFINKEESSLVSNHDACECIYLSIVISKNIVE